MRRIALLLAFAAIPASAAVAEVPSLNVQATCRATPAVSLDQKSTFDNCMRSENAARDRLGKTWNNMRAEWRSNCLKTTTLGGIPSYVELLTCVEMREAAANGQSGAPAGSMTNGRSVGVGSGSPNVGSPVPGATTTRNGRHDRIPQWRDKRAGQSWQHSKRRAGRGQRRLDRVVERSLRSAPARRLYRARARQAPREQLEAPDRRAPPGVQAAAVQAAGAAEVTSRSERLAVRAL